MERTVQMAQARLAIEEIQARYAEGIDRGDLESMAALFAKGELILPDGSSVAGAEAVFDYYHGLLRFYSAKGKKRPYQRHKTTPLTRHVNTNLRCEFDNAVRSAQAFSYFTCYQQIKRDIVIIAGGRYEDHFAKDLAGWHLQSRAIHVDQRGDMSRHLKS